MSMDIRELNELLDSTLIGFTDERDEESGARKVVRAGLGGAAAGGVYMGLRKGRATNKHVIKGEVKAQKIYDHVKEKTQPFRDKVSKKAGRIGKKGYIKGLRLKRKLFFDSDLDGAIEFKDKSTAVFAGLPDDWERRGETHIRDNAKNKYGTPVIREKVYKKAKKIAKRTPNQKADKDGRGATIYEDISPSRVRRAKAVTAAAAAGGLGYAAGKHGSKVAKYAKGFVKKRFSAIDGLIEFSPLDDYKARQIESKNTLGRQSHQGNGALIGAGVVGGVGVARATQKLNRSKRAAVDSVKGMRAQGVFRNNSKATTQPIMNSARRTLRKRGIAGKAGLGLAGAYVGAKVGSAIGRRVRRNDETQNLSALELADAQLTEFQDLGYVPSWRRNEVSSDEAKMDYPRLHIGCQDKALKLGEAGQAMISYKVNSESTRYDGKDGKPKHGADMEILSIEPVPVAPGKKELNQNFSSDSSLSILEIADRQLEQFASRSRDDGGRFTNGSSVASAGDFNAAAQAKDLRKRRVQKGVAGGVAVAGLAGLGMKVANIKRKSGI